MGRVGACERTGAKAWRSARAAAALACLALGACAPEPPVEALPDELVDVLSGDAYAYFRFTNREFARRVCEEMGERALSAPR